MGLIVLMWITTLYVGYSAKKKAFGFAVAVKLLRFLIWLLTQFLYFPTFQLMLSIFMCQENGKGQSMHVMFDNVYCYSGEHLIYAMMGGLFIFLFVMYSLIFAYLNFNLSQNMQDPSACKNSNSKCVLIIYFTVVTMFYLLLTDERTQVVKLMVVFFGSFVLF